MFTERHCGGLDKALWDLKLVIEISVALAAADSKWKDAALQFPMGQCLISNLLAFLVDFTEPQISNRGGGHALRNSIPNRLLSFLLQFHRHQHCCLLSHPHVIMELLKYSKELYWALVKINSSFKHFFGLIEIMEGRNIIITTGLCSEQLNPRNVTFNV